MAINYTLPNWIRGARPAEHYARGYGLGLQAAQAAAHMAMQQAQLNHAAQRLAQEYALAQQRMQIAANEEERRRMHDQQQLEVLKEYHRQQADLESAKIAEQKRRVDIATEAASRQYAATQGYQKDIMEGKDPIQAILYWGPQMGHQASAEAAAIRSASQKDVPDIEVQTAYTGQGEYPYLINRKTGGIHILKPNTPNEIPLGVLNNTLLKADELGLSKQQKANISKLRDQALSARMPGGTNAPIPVEPAEADQKPGFFDGFFGIKPNIPPMFGQKPDATPIAPTPTASTSESWKGLSTAPDEGTKIYDKAGNAFIVKDGVPVPVREFTPSEEGAATDEEMQYSDETE